MNVFEKCAGKHNSMNRFPVKYRSHLDFSNSEFSTANYDNVAKQPAFASSAQSQATKCTAITTIPYFCEDCQKVTSFSVPAQYSKTVKQKK